MLLASVRLASQAPWSMQFFEEFAIAALVVQPLREDTVLKHFGRLLAEAAGRLSESHLHQKSTC